MGPPAPPTSASPLRRCSDLTRVETLEVRCRQVNTDPGQLALPAGLRCLRICNGERATDVSDPAAFFAHRECVRGGGVLAQSVRRCCSHARGHHQPTAVRTLSGLRELAIGRTSSMGGTGLRDLQLTRLSALGRVTSEPHIAWCLPPTLVELDLRDQLFWFGAETAEGKEAAAVEQLVALTQLRRLWMVDCGFWQDQAFDLLVSSVSACRHLEALCIASNYQDACLTTLAPLRALSSLTFLAMSINEETGGAVCAELRAQPPPPAPRFAPVLRRMRELYIVGTQGSQPSLKLLPDLLPAATRYRSSLFLPDDL